MGEIYLDNSATTKPFDNVIELMIDYYKQKYGNPSSMHKKGIEAEKGIRTARKEIAQNLKVEETEIIFTSGGTEGNNNAIMGTTTRNQRRGKHIITSLTEHPSVLNVFKYLENKGFEVTYLKVNKEGKVDLEELKSSIRKDTILVSIMMINNEVGTIQPINRISKIIKEQNSQCIFHVDGVQAFGKTPCHPKEMGIDLFTISSHKIHGPKGIGALYKNKNILMDPTILGGGQETGMRSGTENVPAIVGMGQAVANTKINFQDHMKFLKSLREKMKSRIENEIGDVVINGPDNPDDIAPHILSVSFLNIKGEVLLHSLELDEIFVSTGSACSSRKKGQSHVLKSMGISNELIQGTMRISFSIFNTEDEIDIFIEALKSHVNLLRKIIRR